MGRITRYEAAYRDAYRLADLVDGCISTVCHERASEAAEAAVLDYLRQRNERNAEYQRTYRAKKATRANVIASIESDMGLTAITTTLNRDTLEILDRIVAESFRELPLDSARNAAINWLIKKHTHN